MSGEIFFDLPSLWPATKTKLDASFAEVGKAFENRAHHDAFFAYIFTPKSNRWAFISAGKTATTTALALLFRAEFGIANSARIDDPSDTNRDGAMHRTMGAGVFRALNRRSDVPSLTGYLQNTLRIATVRHPSARAWSAFRYLCRSHDLAHVQFSEDRLRMAAAVQFDWNRHGMTRDGFLRFLDYTNQTLQGEMPVNNHWRPQWQQIRPDLFPAHLLGRQEDMATFARDLAARLETDLPPEVPHLNRAGEREDLPAWLRDAPVRAALLAAYQTDYATFGYDP